MGNQKCCGKYRKKGKMCGSCPLRKKLDKEQIRTLLKKGPKLKEKDGGKKKKGKKHKKE
ncbi:hypothetical protein [Anaerotalea alkaliphila]|uniref:hypothetical protein n=1 Tax=Anaerotalea alkaliphila TaxID=2662126 RepID=UPI001BA781D5|nr:hypothetical protein [Anaerotalea alkaliphila]